jgi:cell division protein ZapA (FtsZ GTPase activity inhibitor)
MGSHFLPIKILGSSFKLKTDEDLDYLKEIVAYFEQKVMETQDKVGIQDPLKVALIAGIVVADELYKERLGKPYPDSASGASTRNEMEINSITRNLINQLSKAIVADESLTSGDQEH